MTLKKLHAAMTKLLAEHPCTGRMQVTVNKPTFRHPLEIDGCVYLDVSGVTWDAIYVADDDGGTKMNRDGSERMKTVVVLFGNSGCRHGRYHRDGECSECERQDKP